MGARTLTAAVVASMVIGGMTACSKEDGGKTDWGPVKVGVVLPGMTTSQRWGSADLTVLQKAFAATGVTVEIRDAQNDEDSFRRIADDMIASRVRVLMISNINSESGKAVLDRARAEGIITIDYDRLTLNGNADYFVGYDGVEIGKLQAEGLVECLRRTKVDRPRVAILHGPSTDNEAAQLKAGYNPVLTEKFDSSEYYPGPQQEVAEWNIAEAGFVFEGMMSATRTRIDGVLAANDGIANAVIEVLKQYQINGKVPVTGQDATVQALQNILVGDQCMTVYKPTQQRADAAARLAASLAGGQQGSINGKTKDPESGASTPSVLLAPKAIFKAEVKDVIAADAVSKSAVCTDAFVKLCVRNGIK